MATIFEITREIQRIQDALERGVDARLTDDPDNGPDAADQALDQLIQEELSTREALEAKLDGYCDLISHYQALAGHAGSEASRLTLLKRSYEAQTLRLIQNLLYVFQALGLQKVDTGLHRVSVMKKVKSVEVDEFTDIPQEFLRVHTEPDKTAIRAALDSGRELPFARWAPEGQRLSIK
jgi:hypothetical protein